MTKINCDVTNCSYNCSGNCLSNRVDIGGMASCSENDTCCGSFLDKKHYSDLTNCAENCTPCDCLVCKVSSCAHNENCLCNLSSIQVHGGNANLYTETNCASFDKK